MPSQNVPVTEPRRNPYVALLLFLTACYGVGFLGAQATNSALGFWYLVLNRPSWSPPNWLFAPVWTVLYGLMGWAAWRVWLVPHGEVPSGRRTAALVLFFAQLVLNGLWSWIFFAWHQIGMALIEIGALWLAILATTVLFWKSDRKAGWLMLPYLAWVAFAAALNFAILRLNR